MSRVSLTLNSLDEATSREACLLIGHGLQAPGEAREALPGALGLRR
jgi:hypothetical protein